MIEVNGLTKIYDGFRAVDNVDLVAKGGKVTILLGPNGAGKSTTIKSIANLLKFDGEIKIFADKQELKVFTTTKPVSQ